MSAEIRENQKALEWLDAPRYGEHAPAPELHRWLSYRGLLTARLRRACGDEFRLQVLEDRDGPGLMVGARRLRKVILWCGELPCVYAESHLPREALDLLPTLRRLGNDPLGEALQTQPGVSRGNFTYARLHEPTLPQPLGTPAGATLWARRSMFRVGDSGLVVAEAFLPGILECAPAPGGD